MTEDLKCAFADDADAMRLLAALESAPQAAASPGFTARTVRAVRRRRLFARLSAALAAPAAAAAVVAIIFAQSANQRTGEGRRASSRPQDALCAQPANPQAGEGRDLLFRPPQNAHCAIAPGYGIALDAIALARTAPAGAPRLRAAVLRLAAAQGAAGGWADGMQTAWCAAALAAARKAGVPEADVPYRKAVRYMRLNGIAELSPSDLARNAERRAPARVTGDPAMSGVMKALREIQACAAAGALSARM